jgi:hypothetical protein
MSKTMGTSARPEDSTELGHEDRSAVIELTVGGTA